MKVMRVDKLRFSFVYAKLKARSSKDINITFKVYSDIIEIDKKRLRVFSMFSSSVKL